jgi:agmatinase
MPVFDPSAAAAPGSGVFGLPPDPHAQNSHVVLVPVPFDATCSYGVGTRAGPAAILEASHQVDLYDPETGRPYEAGITMLAHRPEVVRLQDEARESALEVIKVGGTAHGDELTRVAAENANTHCARVHAIVEEEVENQLAWGRVVGLVGGEHSVSFGSIRAHARRHQGMGVLHVDAHADLRHAYEGLAWSHASVMRNVLDRLGDVSRVVQVGVRDFCDEEHAYATANANRVTQFLDHEIQSRLHDGFTWLSLCQRMVDGLPKDVYVSLDIDGLDPALCPHTGTPVPGGMSFPQLMTLLRVLGTSGRRILGFDLVEVAPGPSGDEWDANVGARLLYKLIGWTLVSRR